MTVSVPKISRSLELTELSLTSKYILNSNMVPRKRRNSITGEVEVKMVVKLTNPTFQAKKTKIAKEESNNNNEGIKKPFGKSCNCKKATKTINKYVSISKDNNPAKTTNKDAYAFPPLDPAAVDFVRALPPAPIPPSACHMALPESKFQDGTRITLVLDVDETLVHCNSRPVADPKADATFKMGPLNVNVFKRPHLDEFLDWTFSHFEVVAFTAGVERVSSQVLRHLDPEGKRFHHKLYRDACYLPGSGRCLKPLNCLGRDLDRVIIVDNTLECMGFDLDNAILMKTWRNDDDSDQELLKLKSMLQELLKETKLGGDGGSAKEFLRKRFQLKDRVMGKCGIM